MRCQNLWLHLCICTVYVLVSLCAVNLRFIFVVTFKVSLCYVFYVQSGPKKWGHKLVAIILVILHRSSNFFTERFLGKFEVKWFIRISTTPCICCHASTWNINVGKRAINDRLLGSMATYLRCGGIVNNQIKKGLSLNLSVERIWKSVNIW